MKIAFCLGRFDLLHNGHIDLFKTAKKHCDFLIVGIMANTFSGLETKKTIFKLSERKEILNGIKYIDDVVCFKKENEVRTWLKKVKPAFLVTGLEYRKNQPLKKFFPKKNILYTKIKKNSSSRLKAKIANNYNKNS